MATAKNAAVKKIHLYHLAAWTHFHKHLRRFMKKADSEELHQMRLGVKKLLALVHFAEHQPQPITGLQLEALLKIFKLSGKLRDNQNAHIFCEKFAIPKSVFKKENEKQEQIFKKLKHKYKQEGSRLRMLEKEIKRIIEHCADSETLLKKYQHELLRQIKLAFTRKMNARELHDTRKKMKESGYLSKLQNRDDQSAGKLSGDIMKGLADLIGDWHDIHKFYTGLLEKKAAKSLGKQLEKVKEKRDILHMEILNLALLLPRKKSSAVSKSR